VDVNPSIEAENDFHVPLWVVVPDKGFDPSTGRMRLFEAYWFLAQNTLLRAVLEAIWKAKL
jgi:hypothetical protein